jgi:hypothetical protein
MTQALLCDQCGRLTSDRPAEAEQGAADSWWSLGSSPAPGGETLLPIITMVADDPDPVEKEWEPPRHFCSVGCLAEWAASRIGGE